MFKRPLNLCTTIYSEVHINKLIIGDEGRNFFFFVFMQYLGNIAGGDKIIQHHLVFRTRDQVCTQVENYFFFSFFFVGGIQCLM